MNVSGKSHAQILVEERTGRDLEELLHELYVDKRWTDQEIADYLEAQFALDVSRTAINGWRDAFGINRSQRQAVVEPPVAS